MTLKYSTTNPENPYILGSKVKGQGHKAQKTSLYRSSDGTQYCRLLRASGKNIAGVTHGTLVSADFLVFVFCKLCDTSILLA